MAAIPVWLGATALIIVLIPVIPLIIMLFAFIEKRKRERIGDEIHDFINVVETDPINQNLSNLSSTVETINYPSEMYGNSLIFFEQEKNQVQYPRIYRNIYAPDKIGHEIALQSKYTTTRRYTEVEL